MANAAQFSEVDIAMAISQTPATIIPPNANKNAMSFFLFPEAKVCFIPCDTDEPADPLIDPDSVLHPLCRAHPDGRLDSKEDAYPTPDDYVSSSNDTESVDDDQGHDPLDILVKINEPTFPGRQIAARQSGVLRMLDKAEPDDKILAVPWNDTD